MSFGSVNSTLLSAYNSKNDLHLFTFTKYENDMLSLCETTNVFIDVF